MSTTPQPHPDDPVAFFITWTIYGSHLQGDEHGWRQRRKGWQEPRPRLAEWRRAKLTFPILPLFREQRIAVENVCRQYVLDAQNKEHD